MNIIIPENKNNPYIVIDLTDNSCIDRYPFVVPKHELISQKLIKKSDLKPEEIAVDISVHGLLNTPYFSKMKEILKNNLERLSTQLDSDKFYDDPLFIMYERYCLIKENPNGFDFIFIPEKGSIEKTETVAASTEQSTLYQDKKYQDEIYDFKFMDKNKKEVSINKNQRFIDIQNLGYYKTKLLTKEIGYEICR